MWIFRTFSAQSKLFLVTRGDAFRCASRLPLAVIFRAVGAQCKLFLVTRGTRSAALHACPWLSYFAPLALSSDFSSRPRYQGRRVSLRFTLAPGIFRAVGAQSLTFSKRHSFVNSRFRLGGGQYRNAIASGRT